MKTAKQPAGSAALFILLIVLAGCAGTDGASSRPATPLTSGPAVGMPTTGLQGGLPGPTGPKKRIAVAKFDAAGAFMAQYGGWDIGGGLAAQLTTALVNSGYFIVVERAELTPVLREQDMAMQKIVSKETAAQVGRILGAQLLVAGCLEGPHTFFLPNTGLIQWRIPVGRHDYPLNGEEFQEGTTMLLSSSHRGCQADSKA